jgi:Flp pilus assembly protein TadG
MSRRRLRGDRGVAVIEFPFGVLLVFAAALMVLTVPTWLERHAAARAAADEAARAVVLADNWDEGAAQAQAIVDQVATNYDLAPGDLTLELSGSFDRGSSVTATVTVTMPVSNVPLVGSVGGFSRSLSHTEVVDPFRSLP